MPLGIQQHNNFIRLTLDVWQDKVFFEEREFPAGYFAANILNISEEDLQELTRNGGMPTYLLPMILQGSDSEAAMAFPLMHDRIQYLAELLWKQIPFCYNDHSKDAQHIESLFREEVLRAIRSGDERCRDEFLKFVIAITRIPVAILNFRAAGIYLEGGYLSRLNKRDETHFAAAAHDCFNSDLFWEMMRDVQAMDFELFSVRPVMESTYVFARSAKNEKEMVFVNRVSFVHFVDFFTFDLMNGMHHGNAPSKCQGCGRYFLTTNGHKPKYCDGVAPQDSRYTCRQYGAMNQQKEQNKQHPVYRLFATRTNTIRKHHQRKKISDELRQAALRTAEALRDKALMDNDYAAGGYLTDMELENIYAEAKKKLK